MVGGKGGISASGILPGNRAQADGFRQILVSQPPLLIGGGCAYASCAQPSEEAVLRAVNLYVISVPGVLSFYRFNSLKVDSSTLKGHHHL